MEEEEWTVKTEIKTERDTQEPLLCTTEQHSQEPAVKTEVKTERDTQEPLLVRLPVPQRMTEQHSQEPGVKTEVKIEIDVAEEPPLEWYMTQQLSQETEVKIEIDVAEEPPLAQQHSHVSVEADLIKESTASIKKEQTTQTQAEFFDQCSSSQESVKHHNRQVNEHIKSESRDAEDTTVVTGDTQFIPTHRDEGAGAESSAMARDDTTQLTRSPCNSESPSSQDGVSSEGSSTGLDHLTACRSHSLQGESSRTVWNNQALSREDSSSEGEQHRSEYKPGSSSSRVSDSDESTDSVIYPALTLNIDVTSTSTQEQRDQRNFVTSTSTQEKLDQQGGVKVSSRLKHKWDKKHCCLFCKKFVLKMSTHLQRVHYKEAKVARIMQMPKGSRERRQEFIKLQDSGDYKNNYKVLQQQKGLLIPKYQKTDRQPADFMVCLHCNGLYLRRLVAKHTRTCAQNTEGAVHKKGHAVQIGRLLLSISKSTSSNRGVTVTDDVSDDLEGEEIEPELQTQESSDEEEDEGGDENSQESKAHTVSLQSGKKNKCPSQTVTQPRKKQAKRPWTKDQKEAVDRHLSHCLVLNRVPQKHEAEQALASEKTLRGRTWKDVKYFVYNLLKKENKKHASGS
ncbi:uncharacterized protein [Littorina saxatilis]|uniref:uncharacterized protein n=1 Tax=Littorina saxatilis TaxID=31220 RepID=UPI0038B5B3C1